MGCLVVARSSVVAWHGDAVAAGAPRAAGRPERQGGIAGRDGDRLAGAQRSVGAPARDAVGAIGVGGTESVARRSGGATVCAGARRDVRIRSTGGSDRAADAAVASDVRRAGADLAR